MQIFVSSENIFQFSERVMKMLFLAILSDRIGLPITMSQFFVQIPDGQEGGRLLPNLNYKTTSPPTSSPTILPIV